MRKKISRREFTLGRNSKHWTWCWFKGDPDWCINSIEKENRELKQINAKLVTELK